MKNKRIIKQGIALLCAAVLLVGGIAIFATNSKAETVAEQLEKDGYTAVTPEDWGFHEETVFTNQENTKLDKTFSTKLGGSSSAKLGDFSKKYLDIDLYMPKAGNETGALVYLSLNVLRIYFSQNSLTIYSPKAAKTVYQGDLRQYGVEPNTYFNLKLATDMEVGASNTKLTMQLWVNNNETPVTLSNPTITIANSSFGTNSFRVLMSSTSKTIKIKPPSVKEGENSSVSSKLDGYTKITPETFGIDGEVTHTYADTAINQAYNGSTSLLDTTTYFDADVSLTATGTALTGGYIGYLNDNFLRIYVMGTTLNVYSLPGSGSIIYQTDLSALGISAGEYFNLRLATKMVDNTTDTANTDVTFQMWINGSLIVPQTSNVTVGDAYASGTNLYVGLTETGTIKVKPVGWVKPEEPDVPEEPVDPNLPSELIGYKKVTPENFGITEEFVYNTVEALYSEGLSKWADVTDFNHAYFDADIALTDTQATNFNSGFGYLNKWMFRFYISGSTLVVYTLQEECAGILYQVNLSEFKITAGEYFNLKFATDITDNTGDSSKSDVKVQMWLNGTKATAQKDTITIGDAYATSNYINMTLAEEGTIKIRPAVVEEPEDPDEPSDPLDGYTKITPENFGITEEVVHTYVDDSINKTHSGTTSMKDRNTYFEADVSLTAAGVDTGYIAYLNQYLLRIYIVGDALTVYTHEGGYEALFQTKLSSFDGTIGEYFHLKFATSMTDNTSDSGKTDITVRMWVNDHEVEPLKTNSNKITVSDAHAGGTNLYVSLSTAGTIKIKPHIEETEEPDVPVVPEEPIDPNLPEELKDYTKVTPQYFGIKKPAVHVYGTNNSGTYTGNGTKSFEKAYFEADIALPKAALETGYIGYLNQSLFRFYMTDTTFVIYSPISYTLSKVGVVYQENLSALGIKAGEYFNLKFATSMTDNTSDTAKTDIAMQIWINDTKVTPKVSTITVTDNYTTGHSLFVKLTEAGTIKVKTHVKVTAGQGERLPDVSYRLSSSSGYLLTGSGDLFVDGVFTDVGSTLTMPGDYVIQNVISPDEIYIQNVTLYEVGDVNLGGGDDWTTADQGELERIIKYGTTSTAAKKAADINNDGKVAKSDLTLIKKVVKGELTKEEVLEKYYTPAITYDFLGGNSVMPIGGYYGPYNAQNITENVYKAIAESGINLIVKSEIDYANEDSRALLEKGMGYAEKYKIGVFVYDTRLNKITASNGVVTGHSYVSNASTLGSLLGDYSKYPSYLGNMIVDEPIANIEDGWKNWAENRVDRYKWYEGIVTALNAYDNQTGYVNLLGQYHMQQQEGYVYMNYAAYLRAIGKSNKVLSFDSYPFWEKTGASGGLISYLKSLGIISQVAREDGYPFWSYIQAGTDFRDDGSEGTTTGHMTKAQALWNVNTSLAFGAKGIVYFPIIQPTYFANVDKSAGTYDYNRNGIIGADDNKNNYYAMVKEANKQVSAVDEVLMKSLNQGVVVTGQAVIDTTDVENVYTSPSNLKGIEGLAAVSGDDAMVGCFTYGDKEAFYVVSYDYTATEKQAITLSFNSNRQYRLIQDGVTSYAEGKNCTITASAGEGVLVVLEDYAVHYEDISKYRTENGYKAPEAPAGYIFAGWYKDKACTKENAVRTTETEVAAYAKFVDANLLTVKAQITAGTKADSLSTSMRFVTSVNDVNYRKVGFIIKIHKASGVDVRDRVDNVVYKKLTAMVDDTTKNYTPQSLFCGTATYFKAWVINNIPQANFDTVFEVTPYWETFDGTIVYGTTANKTVRQGIQ